MEQNQQLKEKIAIALGIPIDNKEHIVNKSVQGQQFGQIGDIMVFVVSGIFILALVLSAAAILATLIGSAPQISDAIAGRNGPARGPRIIHIGAVRHTGYQHVSPAQIIAFKPRLVAAAEGFGGATDILPLAA